MTMEWYELDITPAERVRFEVQANRQGVTVEELISKLVRGHIVLAENLGLKLAMGPGSVDTRNKCQ